MSLPATTADPVGSLQNTTTGIPHAPTTRRSDVEARSQQDPTGNPAHPLYIPGTSVIARDEEWMITAVDYDHGMTRLDVRGQSGIVRDTTAKLSPDLEPIQSDQDQQAIVAQPRQTEERIHKVPTGTKTLDDVVQTPTQVAAGGSMGSMRPLLAGLAAISVATLRALYLMTHCTNRRVTELSRRAYCDYYAMSEKDICGRGKTAPIQTGTTQASTIVSDQFPIDLLGSSHRGSTAQGGINLVETRWSEHDIATHLGISKGAGHAWVAENAIRAYKVGRLWKFQASEIDEWVRRGGAAAEGDK